MPKACAIPAASEPSRPAPWYQWAGRVGNVDHRDPQRHALHFGLGVARTRAPPVGGFAAGVTTMGDHDLGMFDALSDRLRATLANLTGRGRVSEADVDAAMREVRLALLEADVNFRVVKDFVARVRERAVGADILESLTAGQQVVNLGSACGFVELRVLR